MCGGNYTRERDGSAEGDSDDDEAPSIPKGMGMVKCTLDLDGEMYVDKKERLQWGLLCA